MVGLLACSLLTAMTASDDDTPLLFDRVAAFEDVMVASLPEGFEKAAKPVEGTNSVSIEVQVVKVLKGKIAPTKMYTIQCHQDLPGLLARRDANTPRRYLLVLRSDRFWGFLGAGNLYGDLARFIPADASVEKVVTAFIAAAKADTAGQIKMCEGLLADEKLSSEAGRHVNELLSRIAAAVASDDGPKAQAGRDRIATLTQTVTARAEKGLGIDSAVALLRVVKAWPKSPLKEYPASLAAPARQWLAAAMPDAGDIAPTQSKAVADVIQLLAALKDADSKDVFVHAAKLEKAPAVARAAIAALPTALGKQAAEPLEELLRFYDRDGCEDLYNVSLTSLNLLGFGKDRPHKVPKFRVE